MRRLFPFVWWSMAPKFRFWTLRKAILEELSPFSFDYPYGNLKSTRELITSFVSMFVKK